MNSSNIRQYNRCIKFKLDINVRKLTDKKVMNKIRVLKNVDRNIIRYI